MEKEIWKSVVGYKNLYSVSNLGNIKSESRIRTRKNAYSNFTYITKEKILNPVLKSTGYVQYTLYKNGISKEVLGHRVVAEAFLKNKNLKPQINHINGITNDNRVTNLEWCTSSENGIHAYKVLGKKPSQLGVFGAKHNKSKPVVQKTTDGKIVKIWLSAMDAVREKGFESSSITRCCKGQQKIHLGYVWQFGEKS